ncbi:hypothetical protein ABT404_49930, partial [Streptomyces hyaluromycini]
GADRDDAEAALRALPGMDPAVLATIRVRALADPDVALPGLPGLPGQPGIDVPDEWRPWRSYAVRHLLVEGESRN